MRASGPEGLRMGVRERRRALTKTANVSFRREPTFPSAPMCGLSYEPVVLVCRRVNCWQRRS